LVTRRVDYCVTDETVTRRRPADNAGQHATRRDESRVS
jgi:hypothetical protein